LLKTGLQTNSLAKGASYALAAAVAFGATTPLLQREGHGLGPFVTAALLYAGAALFAVRPRGGGDTPLRWHDSARLVAVAALGAMIAPVCLAWGLVHTSGVTASLLLNTEALFTVLLARVFWNERIGRRGGLAVTLMACGGALLVAEGRGGSADSAWGALAVTAATLAWATDNVLSRPLADRDPNRVVLAKATLGASMSLVLSRVFGEGGPTWSAGVALVACGAVGYGASLGLYLRAQRLIGAARTGSIFSAAPFLGAALAWILGQRVGGPGTIAAGILCAAGVALHMTEDHGHEHDHDALAHEHAHRHDDGHHDHPHAPGDPPGPAHSHRHEHRPLRHAHAHGPDLHHRHKH